MLPYPSIPSSFLKLGPLEFKWYGLMYALGFLVSWIYLARLIQKKKLRLSQTDLVDLIFYVFLGVIIGGRLGYILFYNLSYYLAKPLSAFILWEGGMSFHGGLLGVLFFVWLFSKVKKISLLHLTDWLVVPIPLALGLGRLGNFINGELFGRISNLPWCMQFPLGGNFCRHPSQLYELILEGLVLFLFLWWLSLPAGRQGQRKLKEGLLSASFLISYGVLRFLVEFLREPDSQIGLILGGMSLGQVLSLGMIVAGGWIIGKIFNFQWFDFAHHKFPISK